jgi:hypothetical protein
MSFCVYTILYTLEDKKPEENDYIQMFLIWFAQFIKVKAASSITLLVDTRTYAYLMNTAFPVLYSKIECNLSILQLPVPKTHLDGMKMKYTKFDYDEEYLMYLDIDILVLRPLIGLIEDPSNGLYIHREYTHEKDVDEHGFLDALNEEEKQIIKGSGTHLGFSAGKFIIKSKEIRDALFQEIHMFIEKNPNTTYYSVEQPIFNRAILYLGGGLNIAFLNNKYISINFHNFTNDTILIDLRGEPGNGRNHLYKMIEGLILYA